MKQEECIKSGGIGRFHPDICFYCNQIKGCEVAKEDYVKWQQKQEEKKKNRMAVARQKIGARTPTPSDLVCMYCGTTARKCRCKNKPVARFELRTGHLKRGWDK